MNTSNKDVIDIETLCKQLGDLCLCVDEIKEEDSEWEKYKNEFHARRDKMVREFNDFEKCMKALLQNWNGSNWMSDFLQDNFVKKSKNVYEKTMKQIEKIKLQTKKLKKRQLHELTCSNEIIEVRVLRNEMKDICEELLVLFPVARFYNILKYCCEVPQTTLVVDPF